MNKRSILRRRGRTSFDRTTLRYCPLIYEQLENRYLLSAGPLADTAATESPFYIDSVAEGEGSLPELEIDSLPGLSVSTGTGYKAQSKVWQHDGMWWAAVGGSGTRIWRLDGTKWTSVLTLSSTAYRTDVKSDGDLVHVLLFPDGPATKLATAEYVPATKTYKLWSERPQLVDIPLKSGVRIATLDIDSTGRMWISADSVSTIDLFYSDPETNYSDWRGPVTIGTGVQDGDISVVTTLRNGSIGVLWSNQAIDRFLFREHRDLNNSGQRNDAADWEPLEIVAGEAALKVGNGMADDHLNVAVSADGTLYAGVKTGYDNQSYTEIGALVRRPNGTWDPKLYHVSYSGTRPIIVLNDKLDQLMVLYDNKYQQSLTDPISFGAAKTLPLGSNVTSTKDNWENELVVLGGGSAVMIKTDAVANTPPTADNDSYIINEDQVLAVSAANGVLKNDDAPENDSLSVSLVSMPLNGSIILNADGSFSYTPTANYFGSDSFTYKAADGIASSNLATVSISVSSINDVPVARIDAYSIEENQLLTVSALNGVLSNDSDEDGPSLTAKLIQSTQHGSLTFTASTGAFSYQPDPNFSGTDSFTYVAFDGTTESAPAIVTITVNARPVAEDDSYQFNEDGFLQVLAPGVLTNDSDADGDALIAVRASLPSRGTLTLNDDGSFTYQPEQDYFGEDSFTYVATDGIDDSPPATVTIEVTSVNDLPVSKSDGYTVEVDQALTVSALLGLLSNDTDADGDSLVAKLATSPAHGTLSIFNDDGSFNYIPDPGYEGPDSFTYRSNDGLEDSNIVTVSITVLNTAVPLTIALQDGLNGYSGTSDTRIRSDSPTTNFGTSSKLELDGSPDQVSLIRWDLAAIPTSSTILGASITINVGTTSLQDFEIYEALRAWSETTANFLVAATGEPWGAPGAASPSDHSSTILGALTGRSLGLVTIPLNTQGVAVVQGWVTDPSTNRGFVIQDLADNSTDDLDFSSSESSSLGPKLTITYRPTPPPPTNYPPLATADAFNGNEDSLLNVAAVVAVLKNDSDPDGDPLHAALVTGTNFGQLTFAADGSFSYKPNDNFHGVDKFTYRAIDNLSNVSPITTATITVSPVNDAPSADDKSVSTPRDIATSFILSASDIDGDPLGYTIDTLPTFGDLSGTAPDLVYTPDVNFVGTDSFTFHVHDGTTPSATATVSISVNAVNRAPTADEQTVTTDEDITKAIVLSGSDPDGDTLSFDVGDGPTHGVLGGTAPNLSYSPNANFQGTDTFTFKVNDAALDSEYVTVSITVQATNDLPTANDSALTTPENTQLAVTLSGSDIDGDGLTYSVKTGPSHGSLSGTAPNLIYSPNAIFVGSDSFTFEVNDGTGPSNIATVTIEVTPAREPETWSFQDGMFPTSAYAGTQDASVRGDDASTNFGARTALWLDGAPDQTTFIRWDLSTLPAGSIVQSASITINVLTTSLDDYPIYELLVPWSEQQVTYTHRISGTPWQAGGAAGTNDRGTTILGLVTGTGLGTKVITLNSEGIAVLQRWIDNPGQNHGFVFQDFDNANTDDLDLASSDAKSAVTRPKLTISVTLPSAPLTSPLMISPLRNQENPLDVDNDGYVSPTDVLVVFNTLNRFAEGEESSQAIGMFPDVSGDGFISPVDALLVINYLNDSLASAESEGSGEIALLGEAAIRPSSSDATKSIARRTEVETASGRNINRLMMTAAASCNSVFAFATEESDNETLWGLDLELTLKELTEAQ